MNTGANRRLDGWKAIAGFFGRDRTTVARWARERDLPIHHIPGGKQKSVFAFEQELLAWATRNAEGPDAPMIAPAEILPAPDPAPVVPPAIQAAVAMPRRRRIGLIVGGLALVLALVACVIAFRGALAGRKPMPVDPAVMADYTAARDAWGRRTPEDIRYAIDLFEKIIHRDPNFAAARAGLADAWLIYREYGDVSDARAFGAARIAAQKALELDPDLPSAHRALGFIDYWWDNDPVGAVARFTRAIELDERDGQTQFWYANVLADLGEAEAAERHYEKARLLLPGSQPIAVEHACAQWQAGKDAQALALLAHLKTRYPRDATISNCMAWVHIGQGDIRAFAGEYAEMAKIRNEPEILRLSQQISAAVARDPETAHRVLIDDNRREIAAGTRRIREVPAFYASSMGDREELVTLMREASVLGERWFSPAITSRIAARWKGDREIQGLLARLRVPPPHFKAL